MKIAEVSEKFGLTADTLRYYERIGLLQPVGRDAAGIRRYTETDQARVHFIKCMRAAGLSIEVLIDYIELVRQGEETVAARKQMLVEQRALLAARIAEQQKTLDLLDHKISVYESKLQAIEQTLKEQE